MEHGDRHKPLQNEMKAFALVTAIVRLAVLPFWIVMLLYRISYDYWLAAQNIPQASFWERRLIVNGVWLVIFVLFESVLIWGARKSRSRRDPIAKSQAGGLLN